MAVSEVQLRLLEGLVDLYREQRLTDVTLRAGETSVRCHRNVLAASSPYFRAMFTGGTAETQKDEVEVQGIEEGVLLSIVDFMYTGVIDIDVRNVQSLFSSASLLELLPLCDRCAIFMSSEVTAENCIEVFQFARFHANTTLTQRSESYIFDHFAQLSTGDDFMKLELDDFHYLISKDDLNIQDEECVYDVVVRWIRHNPDVRRQYFTKLFSSVRLTLLSIDYLKNVVGDTDIVTEDDYSVRVLSVVKLCKVTKNVLNDDVINPLLKDFNLISQPRYGMFARDMLVFVGGGQDSETRSLTCFEPISCKNYYSIKPHVTFDFTYRIDYHRAVASDRNVIYMIGGIRYSDHHFETAGPAIHDVKRYNMVGRMWENAAPLLNPRCAHAAVFVAGKIFVLGGKAQYPGGDTLSSVECYDPEADRWSYVSPMPHGLYHHSAVVYGNAIFVIGGFNNSDEAMATVLIYNIEQDTWDVIPKMMQVARADFGAVVMDDKLYVCGGTNGQSKLCSFEIYDFSSKIWRFGPEFLEERNSLIMVVLNGFVYICGGVRTLMTRLHQPSRESESKDLWKFDLSTWSWQREVRLVQYANVHACVVASMNIKHLTESEYVSVGNVDS